MSKKTPPQNNEIILDEPLLPFIETSASSQKTDNIYTVWESFKELQSIQDLALSQSPKPDFTAALKSEELKGKLFGLYLDKSSKKTSQEITLDNATLPQILVEFV